MIGHIPARPGGRSARARFGQWAWDALVESHHPGSAPGIRVTRRTHGFTMEPDSVSTGRVRLRTVIVVDDSPDDYLLCKSLKTDGEIGEEYIYVAKPVALRRSMSDHILLPMPFQTISSSLGESGLDLYAEGEIATSTRWLIHHFYSAINRKAYDVTNSIAAERNELDDDYIITGGGTDIKTLTIKDGLKTFDAIRTSLSAPLAEFQVIIPRYLPRSEKGPVYNDSDKVFPGEPILVVSGRPMIPNDPRTDEDDDSDTEPLWKPIMADKLKPDGSPDIEEETSEQKKVRVTLIDINVHARAWARAST
jgi:hypothetical protein